MASGVSLFSREAKAKGLKDRTIDLLHAQHWDSLEILCALEEDHLMTLDIKRGQMGLLKKWRKDIKAQSQRLVQEESDLEPQDDTEDSKGKVRKLMIKVG